MRQSFWFFIVITCFGCGINNKKSDLITPMEEVFKMSISDSENESKWNFKRIYLYDLKLLDGSEYFSRIYKFEIFHDRLMGIVSDRGTLVSFDKSDMKPFVEIGSKGKGPEENGRVKSIARVGDTLFISDNEKSALKAITIEGDLISYYRCSEYFFNAIHLKEGRFMVSVMEENEFGIKIIDVFNESETEFRRFPYGDEIKRKSLSTVFDGDFIMNESNGHVFFFCYYAGRSFEINQNGEFLNTIYTVDKTPPPMAIDKQVTPDLVLHEVFPPNVFFMSSNIYDGQLYQLSNLGKKGSKNIDIYNLMSGDYLGSIRVPNLADGQVAHQIRVEEGNIYILYENGTFRKYQIESKNAVDLG